MSSPLVAGAKVYATLRAYSPSTLGPESRRAEGVVVVPDEEAPVIACSGNVATVDGKWDPLHGIVLRRANAYNDKH